ncbi:lipopolysaccharide biosynthesis protein [Nitratidesulfovibrio sp. SRB-5]|uniref:lipopolysaccharide biosynthesis protein n=1 Tax=Nitratidesulfovibrio sp. SRB-5 TaxID=2872636 RepID=UPI001026BC8E|nr:oligosaccharide flippase family protein [Nitratidesulfovibrio sp. SRB-5]MBZ2172989.1 oligosaccharide flippase family protein [Nitratidesulfovibrio sp. SRB-5]RXF78477.1 polysaccharide biosynthesis protein [Desulfovibrio sp. DS-1]
MSTLGYFARNSVIRILSFAVGVAFALLVTPTVVGAMGKAQYGVWVLVSSIVCYFLLLEGGVMQAVSKYAAAAHGRNDQQEVDRVFTVGVALHGLSCLVSLLVTAALVYGADFFDARHVSPGRLRLCLLIYSSCLAAMFLFRSHMGIIMAEMRWTLIAVLAMLRSTVTSLVVLFSINESNGLELLSAVNGGGFLLESLLCVLIVKRRGSARFRPHLFSRALAREMLGYGWAFTVTQIGESMRYRSQNYIIAWFMGVREVAVFSIAMQFVGYFLSLMQSAFGIMVPYFSRLQADGDGEGTRATLLFSLRLSYMTSSLIAACLIFYGRPFILLWLGEGFSPSYDALVPLSLGAALSLGMLPADGYLLGTATHRTLARCAMAEGVLIVLLSLLLVTPYGIVGVAWAYLLASALFRAGIVPWLVFTHAGMSLIVYLRLLAELGVTHVLPQVLCFLLIRDAFGPGYWQLLLCCCAQAGVAVGMQAALLRWGGKSPLFATAQGRAA